MEPENHPDTQPAAPALECGSETCHNGPTHRFTWPGHDELWVCESCAVRAVRVAEALGLHLQVLPL